MRSSKPGIKFLAAKAQEFTRINRSYLIDFAKPVILPLIAASLIGAIGPVYSPWMFLLHFILVLYFNACFVMSWHRASLLGPKTSYKVDPFNPQKGEGRFIGVYFGLTLLYLLFIILCFVPSMIVGLITKSIGISVAVAIIFMIFSIFLSMRFVFILPARSVNAEMTWREAWKISKGLILSFVGAVIVADFWLILICLALGATGLLIVKLFHLEVMNDTLKAMQPTLLGGAVQFLISIPAVFIGLLALARGVTVLSRLYQWSVQNRPQGQVT